VIKQFKKAVGRVASQMCGPSILFPKKKPPRPEEHLARVEAFEAELLKHLDPENVEVVFDVGACDALDSIRYARMFPRATVYAFEPLPTNIVQAKRNIDRFNAGRVKLIEKAVSSKSGTSDFHVSSGHPENYAQSEDWDFGSKSSSLLPPVRDEIKKQWSWLKFDNVIRVDTITLDEFCAEEGISAVGFMHMDVQGAELQVLLGSEMTLRSTSAIWHEVSSRQFYESQSLHNDLNAFLTGTGFNMAFKAGVEPQWDELWIR
jgi:FkbM family methyltransferase